MRSGCSALALVLGLLAGAVAPAFAASELVIVTSFPKELFEAYKKAFEDKHPGVKVIVKPQQTNQAVTYLRETRARPDGDIFLASSVDAFLTLKTDGLLERVELPKDLAARIPAAVGGFPIHDGDGQFFGFAISGYGLMWNTRYLQAHKLPAPREWLDLTDARYHGHLVMSAPSRSGTTHLTVETILQAYGWTKGWELLLNAGGNMGTITERSFGAPEAVVSGQYGVGVVIDFFGLSAIASGQPVDFAYPSLTAVVPASVAKVRGAPNGETATKFIHYLLSDEGQTLLMTPAIGRLPVVPSLYARAPKGYPNPFQLKLGGVKFDARLSSSRVNLVNALFDQVITFRHAELRAATGAINTAAAAVGRAKAAGKNVERAEALLREARALAFSVPLDEKKADKTLNDAFRAQADVKAKSETEWDAAAKTHYARARGVAEQATAAVR
ncbi:MAG: extracellular solute-binding protein [Candidatus Rokubacteria bacterium]|nr:extracellular solute-binding protein [Candidatus Rokubacteria bacterium]